MPKAIRDRSAIYASRLFSRHPLDVRVRLVALRSTGERVLIHGRSYDVSHSGAGVTLTYELPSGTEVALWMRLPNRDTVLCLRAIIARRHGFRVGLQFLQPTPEQRLLLSELCCA
jgi:hypothetical protein